MKLRMKTHPYLTEIYKAFLSPAGSVAIIMALLSFGGTQLVDYVKSKTDEHRKFVAERVISFIDTTKEFDALAATLANSIMDGDPPDKDLKAKIYSNLNNQYTEIDELSRLVGPHDEKVIGYKDTLQDFNAKLSGFSNPRDLRDYWLMLSNILTARKGLSADLRKKADLEIDNKTIIP